MNKSSVQTLIALIALACVSAFAFPRAEAFFLQRAQDAATETLGLVVNGVDQAIGRYEPLPQLVADDPIFKDLLKQADNEGLVPFINEKLRLMAISLGVSDIYLKDKTGLTIASSNYRLDASFLGKSFEYRPYFQDALAGEIAYFHALGTTSGERGFFFSAPVLSGIDVVGVLTIKVSVSDIEAAWVGSDREIIVADPNGIAFLSSRAEYQMRPLAPLADGQRAEIEMTRQFPLAEMEPVPLSASVLSTGAIEVNLDTPEGSNNYLSVSGPLALGGWHAIVLTPLQPIRLQAIYAVSVLATTLTALGLAVLVVYQRRARLLDRMRIEQDQRNVLELRVQERTADLDAANDTLRVEIGERKRTEERLRKSQKELVQAGKLAALGKMSAALSHEINQPLAAVKSYADNANEFLQRGHISEVGKNISRISEMTDRMAQISKHLRGFARQPGDQLKSIEIGECVRQAIEITTPQMRDRNVTVNFKPPTKPIYGTGGELRLEQVIVNLLNNAADAMEGATNKQIDISILTTGTQIAIEARDYGPGIPEGSIEQIFDAFYTTKEAGVGMGLGLSISYNIIEDFGGSMSVANHPKGGAVFTVNLKPSAMSEAAE